MNLRHHFAIPFALLVSAQSFAATTPATEELVVYSSRNEALIKPVLDAYTQATGVKVKLLSDKGEALLARLQTEGASSPADVLITVDVGNLALAADAGVLQPLKSATINKRVPKAFRDSKDLWTGVSLRARTIFYNPSLVKATELSTYEDLAQPKWKGKLCMRTSKSVYNMSLTGALIAEHGEKEAEKIVKGWVSNFAAPPFSDDTSMLKAIDEGKCAVGVANNYYYGRLVSENPAFKAKIFWANQGKSKSSGTHVNLSGGGIVATSKKTAEARKFLEWLTESKAQSLFSSLNYEFPIDAKAEQNPITKSWGPFKRSDLQLYKVGGLQRSAVMLMERAEYR